MDEKTERTENKENKEIATVIMSKRTLFAVGAIAIVVGMLLGYGASQLYLNRGDVVGAAKVNISELSQKVAKYIDDNFLAAYGVKCRITNWTEYENIIDFAVEVEMQGQKSTTSVYATKDGKFMLLGALFDFSKPLPKLETPGQTGTQQRQNYTRSEKPEVLLFVMSFCPYGQQAERGMFPVLRLLGGKIDFGLHFVIYGPEYYNNDPAYCLDGLCSMHGVDELKENIRQMCVIKYYPDKWMEYIERINANCDYRNVSTCWKQIAEQLGINVTQIENCASGEGIEIARADKTLNEQYGVRGSPTLFINNVEYHGGRNPENYKEAICSAFIAPPSECNQTLSSTVAQASGSCG